MILTEKQPKYQLYHQAKLINMNILLVKKYQRLINKKIVEPAKFTYSPLGKSFEKQIKTIEDQGQKQFEALKNLKPKEQTKAIEDKSDDEFLMKTETYNRLFDKRLSEIREIINEIDYNDLIYNFKTKGSAPINFIKFKGPFGLFREIRDGNISLTKAEENQEDFKKELGQVTSGNPLHKEKLSIRYNKRC